MTIQKFCWLLSDAKVGKNDKKWCPKWLRRYVATLASGDGELTVTEEQVIVFSRGLRDNGLPAWQRLQAVRAVQAYRDLVLKTPEPSLRHMVETLSRAADRERNLGADRRDRAGVADERQLIGKINPNEPEILQRMRRELRVRGKAWDTEKTYVKWVKQFIQYCQTAEIEELGEKEITAFLTELAVERNVTSGTQDVAKNALLFLYQRTLGRELAYLDAVRADGQGRLPVVLSREEISWLLPEFRGLKKLMFEVIYGAGLRHRECRRLRVKDVCFDERHIVVRSGKGNQDRRPTFGRCPRVAERLPTGIDRADRSGAEATPARFG